MARGATRGDPRSGVREWLAAIGDEPRSSAVATFDTRVEKVRRLPGSAARNAARLLRGLGYRPAEVESFYVRDPAGPLVECELERAAAWGSRLADELAGTPRRRRMRENASRSRVRAWWPIIVSLLLCVLLLPAVGYGLYSSSAYRGLPDDVVLTSRAQDLLTLLVLPLLVWSAARSRAGSLRGHVAWLGLLFYLAYSYAIYLVGWQQNRVFLVYVLVVMLSAVSLLDGLVRVVPSALRRLGPVVGGRGVGWFLVFVGVAFVSLWLGDVAPSAFGGHIPAHVGVGGTPYPVYVIDLGIALPVVISAGVMLLRSHPMSQVLASVVLVKITTLFAALWSGVAAQVVAGHHVPFTADMVPSAVLPVVTVVLLVRGSRRLTAPLPGWLRPTAWV